MTTAREAARILQGLKKRVERIEKGQREAGVPMPVRSTSDTSDNTDSVTTSTDTAGGFTWDQSNWDFTEWE